MIPWSLLVGPLGTLIERLFPDKEAQDKAKAEMMAIVAESEAKEMEADAKRTGHQKDVIVAEAKGENWIQRNWRPFIALWFGVITGLIVFFNHIVVPIGMLFGIDIPHFQLDNAIWAFNAMCIGGYIGARSFDKRNYLKRANDNDNVEYIYNTIRKHFGPIPQQFVDELERKRRD